MPLALNHYDIILASQSPRRQQLLRDLGVPFRVLTKPGIDESFPRGLSPRDAALHIAKAKATAFQDELFAPRLLITADTIVAKGNNILGKPSSEEEARQMLQLLANSTHEVITAVCLQDINQQHCFAATTHVHFTTLEEKEIDYYISQYAPFDKAGAYGIQEWIGFVGVNHLEGSYFNVMGLPVQQLYATLKKYFTAK